jgi:hypothetical protein
MSSDLLDNTIRGRQADGSPCVRWDQPGQRANDISARDRAGAHLHLQPELPSRRWYIDATREVLVPEAPQAADQAD